MHTLLLTHIRRIPLLHTELEENFDMSLKWNKAQQQTPVSIHT